MQFSFGLVLVSPQVSAPSHSPQNSFLGGIPERNGYFLGAAFSPLMMQESRRFLLSYDSGTRDR